MLDVLLAAAGWVVVGWVPGFLLVEVLRPAGGRLRNAALAPMVALGLNMIAAQVLQIAHVRIDPWTVLPLSLGLPAFGWAWVSRRRRQAGSAGPRDADKSMQMNRLDVGLVSFAMLLGLFIWCIAIPSLSSVLPNVDGTHHGLFASRVLTLGTIDPQQVLAGDLASGKPTSHYYPLALHLTTALISGITNAPVSAVLTVGYVLASSVLLPLGMFVLTRRLLPQLSLAAPVAAVIAASFPWFPHVVILWGMVPTIVAMSHVPAGIDALWRRHGDGSAVGVGIALGIAGYGVFTEHNSELVTIGIYGLLLALAGRSGRAPDESRRLLATWGVGAGVIGALIAPQVHQLIVGAGEATTFAGNRSTASSSGGQGPVWIVALAVVNPLVLVFAVVGLVIAVARRWCPTWAWCLAITSALCASTAVHAPVISALTAPWYSSWDRISYMFSYFEAVYGAIGVLVFVRSMTGALKRRQAVRPRLVTAMVLSLVGVVAVAVVLTESVGLAAAGYRSNSLIGPDQRAGFDWLASRVGPGGRVLNDFSDGSGWMATLDRVTPVFAVKPDPPPLDPQTVWGDRWYLLTHAGSLSTDPRAKAAARKWAVRYVYINDKSFGQLGRRLSAHVLSKSSAYQQVWKRGAVTIFAIVVP